MTLYALYFDKYDSLKLTPLYRRACVDDITPEMCEAGGRAIFERDYEGEREWDTYLDNYERMAYANDARAVLTALFGEGQ